MFILHGDVLNNIFHRWGTFFSHYLLVLAEKLHLKLVKFLSVKTNMAADDPDFDLAGDKIVVVKKL